MVNRAIVRRSGVAALRNRRDGLTPEAQYSEQEEPNPVWAFAQLRRLGIDLMTVSDEHS